MTKYELIKALKDFSDDDVVIIGDSDNGWSNIEEVKADGCQISLSGFDMYPEHSADSSAPCWCEPEKMKGEDGSYIFIHRDIH